MKDEVNNEITETIFKFLKCMKPTMSYDSKTFHLTMVQFEALIFLKKNKDAQMSDISDYFSITMPSVTVLIDKLIGMKFAQRKNDIKDRRVVKISLTAYGEKLLNEAMHQRKQKINKVLSYLSSEDKKDLLRILQRITDL